MCCPPPPSSEILDKLRKNCQHTNDDLTGWYKLNDQIMMSIIFNIDVLCSCNRHVRRARIIFSNAFSWRGGKVNARVFGYTWICLDTLGNTLDTFGYTWIRVTILDTAWVRLDTLEHVWLYFGYVWRYLATLWQCVTTGGNVWIHFGYVWIQTWKTTPLCTQISVDLRFALSICFEGLCEYFYSICYVKLH